MKKQDWKLAGKSAAVFLALFIFFGALFCAMNNTQKTMTGEAISVVRSTDGWILNTYHHSYRIQPDFSFLKKTVNQVFTLLFCPPRPYHQEVLFSSAADQPNR